ncbi:MAG: hypothetical protein [Bacteriophage sp.]|nr:MAG: hypothetical protein [Bacteriophage sp.]
MFQPNDENALAILNISKVRYEVLDNTFEGLDNSKLNIIVDMYKLFEGFRHEYLKINSNVIYENKLDHNLVAEIMNWVGHYNNYFEQKNCKVNFYLIYGHKDEFIDDPLWNKKYDEYSKFLSFVIDKRLKTLTELTSNIFVINTNSSELMTKNVDRASFLYHYKFPKGIKLLITDDIYLMQFVTNKFSIMRVRNDNCTILNYTNGVLNSLGKDYKNGNLYSINDEYIKYYIALMGANGLEPIHTKIKKKAVLDLLNSHDFDKDTIYSHFSSKLDVTEEEFNKELNRRLKIIDISRFSNLSEQLQHQIITQTKNNIEDKKFLAELNNQFFGNSIKLNLI